MVNPFQKLDDILATHAKGGLVKVEIGIGGLKKIHTSEDTRFEFSRGCVLGFKQNTHNETSSEVMVDFIREHAGAQRYLLPPKVTRDTLNLHTHELWIEKKLRLEMRIIIDGEVKFEGVPNDFGMPEGRSIYYSLEPETAQVSLFDGVLKASGNIIDTLDGTQRFVIFKRFDYKTGDLLSASIEHENYESVLLTNYFPTKKVRSGFQGKQYLFLDDIPIPGGYSIKPFSIDKRLISQEFEAYKSMLASNQPKIHNLLKAGMVLDEKYGIPVIDAEALTQGGVFVKVSEGITKHSVILLEKNGCPKCHIGKYA